MYAFSAKSEQRLSECHIDLQTIFRELIKWQDVLIICGHRNQADQHEAFLTNKSKLDWPNSEHNKVPSMAVDAGPYFVDVRNTDWNDRLAFARMAGRVDQIAAELLKAGAISHEVVWGGDWDDDGKSTDQKFMDMPHFQLKPLP